MFIRLDDFSGRSGASHASRLESVMSAETTLTTNSGDFKHIESTLITHRDRDSLELQDGPGVSVGVDPADEVEVAHVERAVGPAGQRHGGEQHHVAGGAAAARAAGDAPVEAVAHHGADDGRLLGEEHVLSVALVENSWGRGERNERNKSSKKVPATHFYPFGFSLPALGWRGVLIQSN
ncbi:hypothetical protein EYF80_049759 [Liparis tanakae]|uniref:Uncharacterized protein n=1 Tax=Liparis tanakae TaxID=230148 RepID=A0A4Z2FH14_9TELE|nr:hypothetical protein EYF80_049759 [Liparis tanakae]